MQHIYIGLLCFAAVLSYGTALLVRSKNKRTSLEEIVGLEEDAREEKIKRIRLKVRVGFLQGLVKKGRQAGFRVGEIEILLAEMLSATGAFLILTALFSTPYVGFMGIPIGLYLPITFLNGMVKKRGEILAKQLHGCLIMWANSIRSGTSLRQAIEASIDRVQPEINEELKQVKHDMDLGTIAAAALEKAQERIPVAEFKMVVLTARIHKQLGGNLAERFEKIAVTIEDRVATRANLKAYTTQARMGAMVSGAMPFITLGILKVMSPDYLKPMVESPYGTAMLMASVLLVFTGWYIIRRIGDIRIN